MRKLNEALPGLIACILGYGLIAWGIGFLLVNDRLKFTLGLVIGIACACAMAVHMAVTIDESVSMGDEKHARNKAISGSLMRYTLLFVVLAAVAYFEIADVLAACVGVLGLKIAAYAQPLVRKFKGR